MNSSDDPSSSGAAADQQMASGSSSKYSQDLKRRVKFHTGSKSSIQFSMPSIQQQQHNSKQMDNLSSSSGSADDDNDETSDNLAASYQSTTGGGGNHASSVGGGSGTSSSSRKSKKTKWELLEGYRDKNVKISKPVNYEGILLKRRNWPMKGWHKRYFILVDGILSYGKSKTDMTKSKVHGTINAFLSIVSYSVSHRRILIDYSTQSNVFICHLKARTMQDFEAWIDSLKQHRLYYQYKCLEQSSFPMHRHQQQTSSNNTPTAPNTNNPTGGNNRNSASLLLTTTGQSEHHLKHNNSFAAFSTTPSHHQVAGGAAASAGSAAVTHAKSNSNSSNISSSQAINNAETSRNLEIINQINANKKLQPADDQILDQVFKNVEDNLMSLSKILSSLYFQSLAPTTTTTSVSQTGHLQPPAASTGGGGGYQPHHSHQASTSSFDFVTMLQSMNLQQKHHLHSSKSNPNLVINEVLSLSSPTTPTPPPTTSNLPTVNIIGNNGSSITASNSTITSSGGGQNSSSSPKLVSRDSQSNLSSNSSSIVADHQHDANFRVNFYQGAKSINEQLIYIYQQLLLKKQALSVVSNMEESLHRAHRSQSVMSSVSLQDSQLQFYDAIEDFSESDTGSDSGSEQESEAEANEAAAVAAKSKKPAIVPDEFIRVNASSSNVVTAEKKEELQGQKILNRRRKLPATSPDTSQVSMWNILRKAIGKDLSKISLPVILNEPIGILQRLSEEIEYSDLLDTASGIQDSPHDRMVYVAAFVISGYSSSNYRTGAKNFNPLLGETYELTRPDKGWKYVGEQVSHHPPISSTHCQSKTFIHEQIFHAKIKFWGKSMEVHPEGYSRVTFPKYNETYQWNKIVMYVHNVMGSGRKIEHYGEINIRCTNGTSCTITFPKANYSSQKNEFYGDVIYENVVKRKIFGQWHESFMCGMDNTAKTIWRMGAMPEDAHLYYGFTRFAIELNEFTEDLKDQLPPTDTRYRPDQRNLELGQVEKAELEKHRIEEMQRNRRKEMESRGEPHRPLWFSQSEQTKEWQFNGQYWAKRENPGFKTMKDSFPTLW